MSAVTTLPVECATAESLRTVGQLVCLYAELEFAMRCFIEALLQRDGPVRADASLSRHRFEPPLGVLRRLVIRRYATEPFKMRKFRRWRNRVTKLLSRRNTMVHGSWIDDHGTLRSRIYVREVGTGEQPVRGVICVTQVARDIRFLQMDIATIVAWQHAFSNGCRAGDAW